MCYRFCVVCLGSRSDRDRAFISKKEIYADPKRDDQHDAGGGDVAAERDDLRLFLYGVWDVQRVFNPRVGNLYVF